MYIEAVICTSNKHADIVRYKYFYINVSIICKNMETEIIADFLGRSVNVFGGIDPVTWATC